MNPITMRVYGRYAVAKGSNGSMSLLFPNMECTAARDSRRILRSSQFPAT